MLTLIIFVYIIIVYSNICIYIVTLISVLYLKNSLIIQEEKTKEITTVSVVLYVIKNHVHLHKLQL
jgi:hypothetical protein